MWTNRARSLLFAITHQFTHNLTAKLMTLFLLSATIPLLISNYYSIQNSTEVLQKNTVDYNLKVMQAGSGNVSTYFESINQSILDIYKNSSFMSNINFNPFDYTGTRSNEQTLNSLLLSRNDYVYLYYYIQKGQSLYSFSRQMYSENRYPGYEKTDEYAAILRNPAQLCISPEHAPQNYTSIGDAGTVEVLTFSRGIKDISSGQTLAVVSIMVNTGNLAQICNAITAPNEIIALTDARGRIYYCNEEDISSVAGLLPTSLQSAANGSGQLMFQHEDYIVVFSRTYNDLILLKAIPYSYLQRSAQEAMSFHTPFLVMVVLAEILFSVLISFSITKPIKKLANVMKAFGERNLSVGLLETNRKDEIGLLIHKFNEMTRKINNLVNSEYKLKLAKKNAQLSALQAQINPHFMYNALQSLGTFALRRKAPEIYQMSGAIARILRYSLQDSREEVQLETEIENIRNYLYVQEVRFGPNLHVNIQLNADAEKLLVPKLILQPLVENSIKYGIDDEKTDESISITAHRHDQFLEITVRDNGRGVNESNLAMIRAWMREEDDYMGNGNHLGIKNIYNRIKLLYGDAADMYIDSELGKGTVISVRIPAIEQRG